MNEHVELVKKHRRMDRRIVQRIRENPSLMEIPRSNIERWIKLEVEQSTDGAPSDYSLLWKQILDILPTEKILEIIESEDPRYEQLQHGSPFVGILSQDEIVAVDQGKAIGKAASFAQKIISEMMIRNGPFFLSNPKFKD